MSNSKVTEKMRGNGSEILLTDPQKYEKYHPYTSLEKSVGLFRAIQRRWSL